MKKSKDLLAKEKLENAERIFEELELELHSGKEIKSKKFQTLIQNAKDYISGLNKKEYALCYAACTKVYKLLKVSYKRYPNVTERIKSMLRTLGKEVITESIQVDLF